MTVNAHHAHCLAALFFGHSFSLLFFCSFSSFCCWWYCIVIISNCWLHQFVGRRYHCYYYNLTNALMAIEGRKIKKEQRMKWSNVRRQRPFLVELCHDIFILTTFHCCQWLLPFILSIIRCEATWFSFALINWTMNPQFFRTQPFFSSFSLLLHRRNGCTQLIQTN